LEAAVAAAAAELRAVEAAFAREGLLPSPPPRSLASAAEAALEAAAGQLADRLLAEARVALLFPPSRSREIGADADEGGEAARGGGTDQDDELAEALRLPRGRVSECALAVARL